MDYAERAIATRIGELPCVEPAPGWEERAFQRAKREGVI